MDMNQTLKRQQVPNLREGGEPLSHPLLRYHIFTTNLRFFDRRPFLGSVRTDETTLGVCVPLVANSKLGECC